MKRQQFKTKFRAVYDRGDDELSPRLDSTDRQMARLITVHRPEWSEEPYRYSQYLAVVGINYLHQALIVNQQLLSEAISELADRYG